MRESRDPQAQGLDWPGAFSFTSALTLFTWAVLQLAIGDLPHALALLPQMPQADMIHDYGAAFHMLLYVLAAVTARDAPARAPLAEPSETWR